MPTSTQEQYEFAEDSRKNGFSCRGDVGIAPYAKSDIRAKRAPWRVLFSNVQILIRLRP